MKQKCNIAVKSSDLGIAVFTLDRVREMHKQECDLPNGAVDFYPRDAMLARVIEIATCLSVCPSRAGIVSKRRKLAS